MFKGWDKIPEQIKTLSVVLAIIIGAFIIVRAKLVPPDFGELGHFRTSALKDIISLPLRYSGQNECYDCHDDIVEEKNGGFHKNLSCEVCHGPAAKHVEEPEEFIPKAPRKRSYCPVCHEYIPTRPTGFPQIISASHNPIKPCIECHNPHKPVPPENPKECSACHAEISRTISVSYHAYLNCTRCHNVPEAHKTMPRSFIPDKPVTREFCGECHSYEAASDKGIPRVDLASHEEKYVCWQCHYPHLPEAR